MLEQPQAGLIGRFYRQVENRPKNNNDTKHFKKIEIRMVKATVGT